MYNTKKTGYARQLNRILFKCINKYEIGHKMNRSGENDDRFVYLINV